MSDIPKSDSDKILELLKEKACTKQAVYRETLAVFNQLKEVLQELAAELNEKIQGIDSSVEINYSNKGDFEAHFKFSGDTLLFHMHTNIFSFEKHHEIWKSSYLKEDKLRAYCGTIHVYNFLSDTFKYNRVNDPGFLIARIFVNKESHFFTEGKGQFGFLYNDFPNAKLDKFALRRICETAIIHGLNFELLSPPFQKIAAVSLFQVQEMGREMRIRTSKNLGYKFQNQLGEDISLDTKME